MRFAIEVDEEWLDTLDRLTELVLRQPTCAPEEALEKTVFEQIGEQHNRSK